MARNDFKLWVSVPTRFRDLDTMKHVNSTVYFVYFEMARIAYFRDSGIGEFRTDGKRGIPVVSQTCNYRRQVFHPSNLEVGIRCFEMGEKTVHLGYEVYLEGSDTLVADGTTTSAWVDLTIPKSIPLPEELRSAIEAFEGASLTQPLR